jgi:multiple sugar transport system ATP-binding protein
MKLGEEQQIDAPQKVYNSPANLFVAQFLGTPPINVFNGRIEKGDIYIGEDKIMHTSKKIEDQELSVAIRPEGVVTKVNKDFGLTCNVESIQVLGRDLFVVTTNPICTKENFKFIIPDDEEVKMGQIKISVKPNKFYIFSKKNDERIYLEEEETKSEE